MSATTRPKQEWITDEWQSCYREGWKGLIVEAAFSHPAKYARGLIRRIYQHVIEEGWLKAGDVACDPFGGIALGGFDAAMHGAHWVGVELELKFVELGNENIAEWRHRYGHRRGYGSARLIQGDSRKLSEVLCRSSIAISSPPFNENKRNVLHGQSKGVHTYDEDEAKSRMKKDYVMGDTKGNLGELPLTEAGLNLALSAPPFSPDQPCASQSKALKDYEGFKHGAKRDAIMTRLVVSSPPYHESLASDDPEKRGGLFRDPKRKNDKSLTATYGTEPGQLGAMKESDEGFTLAVGSPPYAANTVHGQDGIDWEKTERRVAGRGGPHPSPGQSIKDGYGAGAEGQLGAMMRNKGFDLSVSSPPFEGVEGAHSAKKFKDPIASAERRLEGYRSGRVKGNFASKEAILRSMEKANEQTYGDTEGNIGNQQGQDFWSAARQIVEETYKVLAPGAHAIWVVKGFVRKSKYVDFPDQWRQLCEAVGFTTLHWHNASLIEKGNTQANLLGEADKEHSVARKSFFRRLAESKGSPEINAEVVLCMVK